MGSIVRVPLGRRRVRGHVLSLRQGATSDLKEVLAVSGELPVFDAKLLETLRWASLHYIAPLSTVVAKASPPNLPRSVEVSSPEVAAPPTPELVRAIAAGSRRADAIVVGPEPLFDVARDLALAAASGGRNAVVVAPTVEEADRLALELGDDALVAHSGRHARTLTRVWAALAGVPGTIVVGTRDIATWPMAKPGVAVVLGDGRRGMKERSTPTLHVRDVLRKRGGIERFPVVTLASVPTTESLARSVEIVEVPGRAWPLVEIVDRAEDAPGSGVLSDRVRQALHAVTARGGRVFMFTRRRGYAPAFRCVRCSELRRCAVCGAAASQQSSCQRCGAELGSCSSCQGRRFEPLGVGVGRLAEQVARLIPAAEVSTDPMADVAVRVGTERDLPVVDGVDLAVVVDGDGIVLAPSYRAEEDALRLMARVAQTVGSGRGRRAMVQTSMADHRVYAALRRGDGLALLDELVKERHAQGFPPGGDLIAIEVTGDPAPATDGLEAAVLDGEVIGPADVAGERWRWLVQGGDLRRDRIRLRRLVSTWRQEGRTVRVDADPIDL